MRLLIFLALLLFAAACSTLSPTNGTRVPEPLQTTENKEAGTGERDAPVSDPFAFTNGDRLIGYGKEQTTENKEVDTGEQDAPLVIPFMFANGNRSVGARITDEFVEVYKKVSPAVVTIFSIEANGQEQIAGTGFFWDKDGHIITNEHVIRNRKRIILKLNDGRTINAVLRGSDPMNDLAVLKIDPENLKFNSIKIDKSPLEIGQKVAAIGSPAGLRGTMTEGIISGLDRYLPHSDLKYIDAIQTDAAINIGNSGGPLLNSRGELIGVNSARSSKASGISFAIPSRRVESVAKSLIECGFVNDLTLTDLGIIPKQSLISDAVNKGIVVQKVAEGSAAQMAGMRDYDTIRAIGETPVYIQRDLDAELKPYRAGDTVKITVNRQNLNPDQQIPLHLKVRYFPPC